MSLNIISTAQTGTPTVSVKEFSDRRSRPTSANRNTALRASTTARCTENSPGASSRKFYIRLKRPRENAMIQLCINFSGKKILFLALMELFKCYCTGMLHRQRPITDGLPMPDQHVQYTAAAGKRRYILIQRFSGAGKLSQCGGVRDFVCNRCGNVTLLVMTSAVLPFCRRSSITSNECKVPINFN